MLAGITFQKSSDWDGAYYIIRADGWYVGNVRKENELWSVTPTGGVASEAIHRTRKTAVESILPFATVEILARVHWANATDEDRAISAGDSPIYLASRDALLAGIARTYPDMDAQEVYYEWTEHGETILQTVRSMRQEAADWAAYQAEVEAEEDIFNTTEDKRLDAEAARIRAEWEAEVDDAEASIANVVNNGPVVTIEAEPAERQAAFLVTSESDGSTRVTVGIMSPDMPTDKATGVTKTGIPFNVFTLDYQDAGRAWRMVDTLAKELREWRDPFHVAIVGTRPDVTYQGTVYTTRPISETEASVADVIHRMRSQSVTEPTYRAAGFPSLDAAIGAGYAHR